MSKNRPGSTKRPTLDVLYRRDRGICYLCGQPCPRDQATRHHVVPLTWGGMSGSTNVRLAHYQCNQDAGSNLPQEPLRPVPPPTPKTQREINLYRAMSGRTRKQPWTPAHGQPGVRRSQKRRYDDGD